ncbi:hypothetical protein GCM10020331_070790 [Ectobacillus funiculus]
MPALDLYRRNFRPSSALDKPYAMVGLNVVAADTDEEAQLLATSMQQMFLNLLRNKPGQLPPPVENLESFLTEHEKKAALQQRLATSVVGSAETVRNKLQRFLDRTEADEMIINSQIFDHNARLRSYEIVAEVTGRKA